MGTIASTNPLNSASSNGLSDLLQTLTSENSPLLSTLSSPNIEKALESAPASDIVALSAQAQQLQSVDALFGISSNTGTETTSLFSALAAAPSSASTGLPLADQLAAYQNNAQTQETQTLLGITPPGTTNNSLFDVFA